MRRHLRSVTVSSVLGWSVGLWAAALLVQVPICAAQAAVVAAPAPTTSAAASGPKIELPPDAEGEPAAAVTPAVAPAAGPAPAPSVTPAATAPAVVQGSAPAAAAGAVVPIQSEFLFSDLPTAPDRQGATLNLARQSQIDVAIDPRARAQRGFAIGGYGEAILNAPIDKQSPVIADLRRTILFLGYNFTDRIRFFAEIEFEHALTTSGAQGEVAVEQAMMDFMLWRPFNLRAGMLLMPVGLVNQYHEPSTFNGVERPDSDTFLIPSTWKQLGVGAFGALGPLRYQVYLVPGLRAEGFSAATGIRGGVQDNLVRTRDVAAVARLDFAPTLGLNLGLSGYVGGSGQGDPNLGAAPVGIVEADLKLGRAGVSVRAQLAYIYIGDVESINTTLRLANLAGGGAATPFRLGVGPVARQLLGGYLELGYDVLRPFHLRSGVQLIPFVRYERTNTQFDVPQELLLQAAQPGNDRTVYTAGLTLRPIFEIAIKLDYQLRQSEVIGSSRHFLNAALAYQF